MKKLYLIAYDISKDKKRNKIAKSLGALGWRVNYSVFECFLSKSQLKKLVKQTEKTINPKTDSVLIYPLCKSCFARGHKIGLNKGLDAEMITFV